MVLRKLFQRSRAQPEERATPMARGRKATLPRGVRVYAIGDIHGRVDLLNRLHDMIRDDRARQDWDRQDIVVYLGDYVDRGFDSRQVIDLLCGTPIEGAAQVMLIGNHDLWFREFMKDPTLGPDWIKHGGDATLLSYGARLDLAADEDRRFKAAQDQLVQKLPRDHLTFLNRLELAFALGDYFFVHAGIRPGVPFEEQVSEDLLWIREPFLGHVGDLGKVVVHGHTVENEPVVRANRIGIDTGGCFTGQLTCLVLEGTEHRFLATASAHAHAS